VPRALPPCICGGITRSIALEGDTMTKSEMFSWAFSMTMEEVDRAGINGWIDADVWDDWICAHYWLVENGFYWDLRRPVSR